MYNYQGSYTLVPETYAEMKSPYQTPLIRSAAKAWMHGYTILYMYYIQLNVLPNLVTIQYVTNIA